jgi:hypothetical protein
MFALTLRTLAAVVALTVVSTALFAWRWPATWRLSARPFGTSNQPREGDVSPASDDLAPTSPALAWMLLIGLMALLFGAWLLLVLLS